MCAMNLLDTNSVPQIDVQWKRPFWVLPSDCICSPGIQPECPAGEIFTSQANHTGQGAKQAGQSMCLVGARVIKMELGGKDTDVCM